MTIRRNLPTLCLIRALFWTHFFSAVLVPFFSQWGGLRLSQILLLNAWFMAWNAVWEAPTGAFADAFGRKASLAAGCALGAAAAWLYVSRPAISSFMAAETVFALGYCLHSGADEALAYDTLRELGRESEATAVLARMESFKLGGVIVGAASGGFIAARWGLAAPLRAYIIPALGAGALSLTLREPPHAAAQRPALWAVLREGATFLASRRELLALSVELALTNAWAWAIIWLYQPLLGRAGWPVWTFGIVHAASCLAQIGLLSRVGRLAAALGSHRRLMAAMTIAAGGAFLALGAASRPWPVAVAVVAAFAFGLPRLPVFSAFVNPSIPSRLRAMVLSFMSLMRTAAIVVCLPLTGLAADRSLTGTAAGLGVLLTLLAGWMAGQGVCPSNSLCPGGSQLSDGKA